VAERGRFITLEGGEGAGKSTQTKRLGLALDTVGIDAVITREPGGAPAAENIRALLVDGDVDRWTPMSEALLNYAARLEHMRHTISPALDAGKWVISDRFADSTMAYQGYGHQLGADRIAELHTLTLGDFLPDLTIVLDIPVEAGLARAGDRVGGGERYERMDEAFHQRLRDGFIEIARGDPDRCAIFDASGDIDAVQAGILAIVNERLGVSVA
jgi:dTMP kinase